MARLRGCTGLPEALLSAYVWRPIFSRRGSWSNGYGFTPQTKQGVGKKPKGAWLKNEKSSNEIGIASKLCHSGAYDLISFKQESSDFFDKQNKSFYFSILQEFIQKYVVFRYTRTSCSAIPAHVPLYPHIGDKFRHESQTL